MLGYPNYSKNDDKIIFNSTFNLKDAVNIISMQADKLHPTGTSAPLITDGGKWGVWYSQGIRTVGLNDAIAKNKLRVYPNPASGKVVVDLSGYNQEKGLLELYDISGKKLEELRYSALQAEAKMDLSTFKKGVYLLKVTDARATTTIKVIRK